MFDVLQQLMNRLRQSLLVTRARGRRLADAVSWAASTPPPGAEVGNDLQRFFDNTRTGPGLWKWRHYFEVYDRHLAKFRGMPVTILEIGVYSGGSLLMWREYFGPQATIVGVDIEPACRAYEKQGVKILIGDQSDRSFWAQVRSQVPKLDIVIDDGGHVPDQQAVTIEELLPHMAPGGVYICEDIQGEQNRFARMASGLAEQLNASRGLVESDDPERRTVLQSTAMQRRVHSVHLYPLVLVVEMLSSLREELFSSKHGTEWQPFLE